MGGGKVLLREWVLKLVGEAGSCAHPLPIVGWRFLDPGDPGGECDVFGVFLLLPGMLLCVGCLVAKAYPQDFDSPYDLAPF